MLHYDLMVSILFERIQFLSWIPPRLFYKNCARAYCMDVLGVMTMVKRAISALGSISHLDSEAIVSNHSQGKKLNLPNVTQWCKGVYFSISPI